VGVSRDCPNFWTPPIISGTGKATDFKFCRNIHRVDRFGSKQRPVKNVGNSSRERSQGVPKIFRAPMYRAHCAVIFAMLAQLYVLNCPGNAVKYKYWCTGVINDDDKPYPPYCPSVRLFVIVT